MHLKLQSNIKPIQVICYSIFIIVIILFTLGFTKFPIISCNQQLTIPAINISLQNILNLIPSDKQELFNTLLNNLLASIITNSLPQEIPREQQISLPTININNSINNINTSYDTPNINLNLTEQISLQSLIILNEGSNPTTIKYKDINATAELVSNIILIICTLISILILLGIVFGVFGYILTSKIILLIPFILMLILVIVFVIIILTNFIINYIIQFINNNTLNIVVSNFTIKPDIGFILIISATILMLINLIYYMFFAIKYE